MEIDITLTTNDEKMFQVPHHLAEKLKTVKNLMDDVGVDFSIPLTGVDGKIMKIVVDSLNAHNDNKLDDFNNFVKNLDQTSLFETILAANYLDYQELLDLTCKTVAEMIKGKTPDEIRKTFNIKNDFSPEEEKAIKEENNWTEEK